MGYEYHVMFTFKHIICLTKASARSLIISARSMDRTALPCLCSYSAGLEPNSIAILCRTRRTCTPVLCSYFFFFCLELGSA